MQVYKKLASMTVVSVTLIFGIGFSQVYAQDADEKKPIKVFLLGGQSNMQGHGNMKLLSEEFAAPFEDILFYFNFVPDEYGDPTRAGYPSDFDEGQLIALQPGSSGFRAIDFDFGPEISFGHALKEAFPNDDFALIKYAVGGTSLQVHWDVIDGWIYHNFQKTVEGGLNALDAEGYEVDIVGMLWTQGARDVVTGNATLYEDNLKEFIADIRSRYGASLPFFFSQISVGQTDLVERTSQEDLDAIRTGQAAVADSDPLTFMMSTDGFPLYNDNLHFDNDGLRGIGEEFVAAYQAYLE